MRPNNDQSSKGMKVWLPLLFAIVLVLGMLIGMELQPLAPTVIVESHSEIAPNALGNGKIEELIRYIEAKYVDEVDREELVTEAIDNILDQLDPHSNYITAEQLQEVNEQLEGNFDGIGVEFMILDDTIVVVAPLAGGPSEAAGILAGDKIIEIGDTTVAGVEIENKRIMEMLRGEKDSEVKIGVQRKGEDKLKYFSVKRDKIPMHSVDVAYMLDQKTGYIKINRFSATTYKEFMKGLEELVEEKGMKDLVIDLRHNPGGYLQQATNILDQLFKGKDKLLVYTEGRSVHRNDYESTGRAYFDVGNVAILIDEGSASASEILAGALQDHDRAVIIGRRSFGKGLVQEQYKLRDGSALRLTVARYYTPSGRSIQKSYDNLEAYENDVNKRLESGELLVQEPIAALDSQKYFTVGGRIVYGGGGILPDSNMFIPLDTMLLDEFYLGVRQYIPQFIFRFLEKNEGNFEHYDLDQFAKYYQVSDNTLDDLLTYAEDKGAEIDRAKKSQFSRPLKTFLKARIAKHLFEDVGFYKVWNTKDPAVKKALNVLGDKTSNPLTIKAN